MSILHYDKMGERQRSFLHSVLLGSFEGEYEKKEIRKLGKMIAGNSFEVISREGIKGPVNYHGEMCLLLRLTEMPIQKMSDLVVVDFLGYKPSSIDRKVSLELANIAARDVGNIYHNVRHFCSVDAGIGLAKKEGISERNLYNIHNMTMVHDVFHSMIFGDLADILYGDKSVPGRLERKSLKRVGVVVDGGDVRVARNSPFNPLPHEDILVTAAGVETSDLKYHSDLKNSYSKAKSKGEIPELLAVQYIFTRMDLAESMTMAGSCITTQLVMAEESYALECCYKAGKLSDEKYKEQYDRIQKMGTLEGMIGFLEFAGPRFSNGDSSFGEQAFGFPGEVDKMIFDAKKGIRPSIHGCDFERFFGYNSVIAASRVAETFAPQHQARGARQR